MLKVSQHKNALIGGLLGGVGGGQLVIELLDAYTNVHLNTREGALVAGVVATGVLLAGRAAKYVVAHGVVGGWHRILHGAEAGGGTHAVATPPGKPNIAITANADELQEALRQAQAALEPLTRLVSSTGVAAIAEPPPPSPPGAPDDASTTADQLRSTFAPAPPAGL